MHVAKGEVLAALGQFYACGHWEGAGTIPEELKQRVSADFLKKNACVPLERKEGTVRVAVEDPYDLTRLDAIKAMNLAPRCEFLVGLREDILNCVRASYGEAGPIVEEADLGRIINDLGTGEEGEIEGDGEREAQPELDETDSGVVKLCQPDHHRRVQHGRLRHPRRALRQDDALHRAPARRRRLPEVPGDSGTAPQRARAAAQDHGEARHRREAQAAGRQDPLPRADGHDRAARRHDPDVRTATRTS